MPLSVLAFRIWSCKRFGRAASCMSSMKRSAFGSLGFKRRAITLACGTNSESSSRRFCISSTTMTPIPARLPPGHGKLATNPVATGSPPLKKTIGIVEVTLFAASTAASPVAAMASTARSTRSAAIRLSDKTSRLRPRLAAPTRGQAYETAMPVEVRGD